MSEGGRRERRLIISAIAAVAVGASLICASRAPAVTVTEFSAGITPNAGLGDIATDQRGNLWFTEENVSRVGRMTPGGHVTEYTMAPFLNPGMPFAVTSLAVGKSGSIWGTGPDLQYILLGLTPGGETLYTSDFNGCRVASQLITGIGSTEVMSAGLACGAVDPEATTGTESFALYEGRLSPLSNYSFQASPGCSPYIANGPGALTWLTCIGENGGSVIKISGADAGSETVYWQDYVPDFVGLPGPIIAGPDGNMWFTQTGGGRSSYVNAIGRITPLGQVASFRVGLTGMGPHRYGVHGITVGPDGNIWFTEPAADRIGRITPGGVITEFPLPAGANPQGITAGPGRALWFTEPGLNRIGRIDLNEAPDATIAVSGPMATSEPITVDGSGSSDVDGAVTDYRWELGDGSSATGPRVSHAYGRPGTYTVTLVVTDNEGAEARTQRALVIADPALRVARVSASVRWSLAGANGRVAIAGTSERAARVAFGLARGGRTLALGEVDVPAGAFTVRVPAPRSLRPGTYQLTGRKVSPGEQALRIQPAILNVGAPPQGIVDQALTIDARGRAVRPVRPLGTRRLSVRFRVTVPPKRGTRIETRWLVPGRKTITDPAPKRTKGGGVVSSIFSRTAPLPQGIYVCQLRSGGTLVASVKIRIG